MLHFLFNKASANCLLALAVLTLPACAGYHRHLHRNDTPVEEAALPCPSLQSQFLPDVKEVSRDASLVTRNSYYYSKSYVRVRNDALIQLNQVLLQDCLLYEEGKLSSEKYAERVQNNTVLYSMLAIPPGEGETASDKIKAIAQVIRGLKGAPEIDVDKILAEIGEVREASIQSEDIPSVIRAEIDKIAPGLIANVRNQMREEEIQSRSGSSNAPELGSTIPQVEMTSMVISFDFADASLSSQAQAALREFVRNTCCGGRLELYGFADLRGDQMYNRDLAQFRVANVKKKIDSLAKYEDGVIEVIIGETNKLGPDFSDNRAVYLFIRE